MNNDKGGAVCAAGCYITLFKNCIIHTLWNGLAIGLALLVIERHFGFSLYENKDHPLIK